MNPIVQEDFTPVEPDENQNGFIDLWENEPYLYGFTDTNHNGFDDYYEAYYLEPESEDNYDVVVDVCTTRSAALLPDPASSTAACGILVESHASKVSGLVSSACRVHSGPVAFVCEKTKGDHTVGYEWSSEPAGVTGDTMTNLVSVANFQTGTYEVKCTVSCKRNRWRTSRTTHAVSFLNVYDCTTPPVILSVYENDWHIPTNISATCGTPERVYVGFDHAKVNTRNLPLITVESLDENVTDHCLGVVWEEDGQIDLFPLLGNNYLPYKDDLTFTTTGSSVDNGKLIYGDEPDDLLPQICLITVRYDPSSLVCDRLWVVIVRPATLTKFNNWVAANSDMSWTTSLPSPFSRISLATNALQVVTAIDPADGASAPLTHCRKAERLWRHRR